MSARARRKLTPLNTSLCNTNGAPVLNITYKVINDPDLGVATNPWATDNYNKNIKVWDQGDSTYCAIVKYDGQFVTLGPTSPQNGVALSAGIKGTFQGGYQGTFTGTFAPGTNKTNGNLPTVD